MINKGTITFFLSAKSDNAKNNTLNKIKKAFQYNPDINYSFVENEIIFELYLDDWDKVVFFLIKLSQTLGTQWIITGSIDFEISLWTNNPKIVGVESINIVCDNPKFS